MSDTDPIVVTGMGAVSPLGVGVEANLAALMASPASRPTVEHMAAA